ncbi:polyubiquitin-like [Erpetoichthys calabaricus]|uniref:Polyubiquitin-like n=1 Tax=Erpetoichthys calabaricus TaxID=27687 RepID=A0A8C4T855_ERPCA|nr:polyubiquitin-like [Erpetoichthys calabaricus]
MGKIYQVIINGLRDEKTTIDLGSSEEEMNNTTVLELKTKILQRLPGNSDSPEDLRLIFANKQLEDSAKLSDYQIKDKSIILMVLRLPGGN